MNNNNQGITPSKNDGRKSYTNLWILPYANLMTILMILFLVLYSLSMLSSGVKYEKFLLELESSLGKSNESRKSFVNAAEKIEKSFKDRGLDQVANMEINSQRIKISLAAPILFDSGSAEISSGARPILQELAGIIASLPNDVTVEGHTCDIPVSQQCLYRSNLELSGARAFNVIKYMIENNKLNPERFAALGCGDNYPLKPNDCEENRAFNRRVEITIEKYGEKS